MEINPGNQKPIVEIPKSNQGKRFLSLLEEVNSGNVQDPGLKSNMGGFGALSQYLIDEYTYILRESDIKDCKLDDKMIKTVSRYRSKLEQDKKEIKLEEAIKWGNYVVHVRNGDIVEYVMLEKRGLLLEKNKRSGFINLEQAEYGGLEQKWKDVFLYSQLIRENPKANGLYNEMIAELKKSAKISRRKMAESGLHNDREKRISKAILEQVERELEFIEKAKSDEEIETWFKGIDSRFEAAREVSMSPEEKLRKLEKDVEIASAGVKIAGAKVEDAVAKVSEAKANLVEKEEELRRKSQELIVARAGVTAGGVRGKRDRNPQGQ